MENPRVYFPLFIFEEWKECIWVLRFFYCYRIILLYCFLMFLFLNCSWCVGDFTDTMAAVDLRLAVHRRQEDRAGWRVLHTVYRDESLYNIRHGDRRVLRACNRYDYSLLADMARDWEKAEGPAEFTSQQTGRQQEKQLKVVVAILTRTCFFFSMEQKYHFQFEALILRSETSRIDSRSLIFA